MDNYIRKCQVIRVVDGDTVILDVDLGFDTWVRGLRFRLARINAPEMNTPGGKRSFEWLRGCDPKWVKSLKLDKWGRWLAELYSPNGLCYNDEMVKQGMAVFVFYGSEQGPRGVV